MNNNQKIRTVIPEPLTEEGFAPFGKAILRPKQDESLTKTGTHWECWFGEEDLTPGKNTLGIVTTRWTNEAINVMEAHSTRELLIPLDKPIIQAVAPLADMDDINTKPDLNSVRAFILEPGQSIMMEIGTWHYAAMPYDGESIYYFVTNRESTDPGGTPNRWIEFENDQAFILQGR
jgi:ureidoglycolate lyase